MEIKGIVIPGGFALKSGQPLDARSVVKNISDLNYLVEKGFAYVGMSVYVDSKNDLEGLYIYTGNNTVGVEHNGWVLMPTTYADLPGTPEIPVVNDTTLTIQTNGTTVGTFTTNAETDATINITIPKGTAANKDVDNTVLENSENLVTSGAVYAAIANVPTGTVTSVGVSMPTGLTVQPTTITDTGIFEVKYETGYSIPTTEKQEEWNSKQNYIDDLTTIRDGAALGATALQTHQDISGKQDVISDLDTIRAGAALGATALQQHQDISGKQDVISDLATIREGAEKGATAIQPAALNGYALKTDLNNLATKGELSDIQLLDTKVKLESELKTYYNVGRITNASGTNPVTIGNAGDSLRDVFNRLFNMDEVQPNITQQPSVSCSLSSDASDERGTAISSISYSITFNDGAYTNSNSTGVSMTSYSFSSGTASSTSNTSGTLSLPSTYTVGTSPAFSTTLTANHSQGNIAKTNLGNDSHPIIRISSGSKTDTPSFSKSAVDYPYFASSTSTSASTAVSSKSKKSTALTTSAGVPCTYGNGAYVWIFVRKGSATSQATKTIETYSEIAKAWGTLLGGTEKMGEVTFNKANGVSDTFYAYRTKNAAQEGATFTLRLN